MSNTPRDTATANRTAFVTGATGLLGNNLVRELVSRGFAVKALARSAKKAATQFAGVEGVEVVVGDLGDIGAFASAMQGCDVVFHTAAFFRDSYKGGSHAAALEHTNVAGTEALLHMAYANGIRRFVHVSSIAVLAGVRGEMVSEDQLRDPKDADDYYRSKIMSDRVVLGFLASHPDFHAVFVLPGWMWGPGDIGPTMAGQFALDVMARKLPGIVDGTVSVVDARDVALAAIFAESRGNRGERYLAAGRHITTAALIPLVGSIAGVPTPTRRIPMALLVVVALIQEAVARVTGKPALLSWATVRALRTENERSRFNPEKAHRELGLTFRPMEQTLSDTIAWYRQNGFVQ